MIGLVLFAAGAWLGYVLFDHVQLRVDVWLHALDPQKVFEQGYGQVAQAQFAMATGGLVGTGLGLGSPGLIPFASTDFIFAAVGEELGLLGTTVVLLLYVVLVGKGLRIALEARDGFGQLLATGLATLIGLQTFVIVGGVIRVIPLTGRDASVHVVRRVEPRLELRPARAARVRISGWPCAANGRGED